MKRKLSITENNSNKGIVSLSLGNIILFKSDIERFENAINSSLSGGVCTHYGVTAEYNKRSKYVHLRHIGKYPLTILQELLAKAKEVL